MKVAKLTNPACRAHKVPMVGTGRAGMMAVAMLGCGLGGCISVTAPDKPIVIQLDINVKQDVVYHLAPDVQKNIEQNPEIF